MNLFRLATCITLKTSSPSVKIKVGLVSDVSEGNYHIYISYGSWASNGWASKLVWITPRSVSGRLLVETRAFMDAPWETARYVHLHENNWSP